MRFAALFRETDGYPIYLAIREAKQQHDSTTTTQEVSISKIVADIGEKRCNMAATGGQMIDPWNNVMDTV